MTEWAKWTDAEPVTDDMMLEHWGGLITYMTRQAVQSYGLHDDRDDLQQSVTLALLALPQATRPLIGYCKTTMNNALRDAIAEHVGQGARPKKQWKDNLTLDYQSAAPSEDSDGDDTAALDRLVSIDAGESTMIDRLALRAALDALPELEREAIVMVYLHGYQVQEVAARLSVSVYHIRRRVQAGLRRLKARLQ
jgi:RNA polymerase sigma factor (sigma-70 family)